MLFFFFGISELFTNKSKIAIAMLMFLFSSSDILCQIDFFSTYAGLMFIYRFFLFFFFRIDFVEKFDIIFYC